MNISKMLFYFDVALMIVLLIVLSIGLMYAIVLLFETVGPAGKFLIVWVILFVVASISISAGDR